MGQNLSQDLGEDLIRRQKNEESLAANIRVAVPGIIQNFDAKEQTVRVQPAIREVVTGSDYTPTFIALPELLDVPVVLPRAGDYVITLPIRPGDECLVVFADQCIDAWWQSGGVQNQMDRRRHDLSDGFAILGVWSQPRRLNNYDSDGLRLLNTKTGSSMILDEKGVTIQGTLTVTGNSVMKGTMTVAGDSTMQGALVAGGVDLVGHTHTCPDGQTGGPQ